MALTKVTEKIITDNLSISGIASASNFKTGTTDVHSVGVTAGSLVVGSAVTSNSDGIDVTGIVTATSFVGSGANLTGIDATSIKHTDGNVKIQAINTGANVTGNLSVSGNLGIAGVLTYEDVTNVDSIGIITARSTVSIADSIVHLGDTDTSLRFPTNNQISFETAGNERLRIKGDGQIYVGSDNTDFSDAGTFFNLKNDTYGGRIGFSNNTASAGATLMEQFAYWGTNKVAGFIALGGTDTTNKDDGELLFYTRYSGESVAERLRITSGGQVIAGHTSTLGSAKLNVIGDSTTALADNAENFTRANDAFALIYNKNTGNVESGLTILSSGSAGAAYNMYVKKTGSYAGDLIFRSRTGASSSAERLLITSTGNVIIGTSSWNYEKPLNVQGGSGSIISLFNGDITSYSANTNASIEFKLKTSSSSNDNAACEIRGFKENGTTSNTDRGLSFYTGVNGASPGERLRITSFGDVYATNSTYNTYDNAATSVETVTQNNENKSGVYWLNFNGVKFRAYVKPNWLQGRNWVLAAKYFDPQDMPSGSSLWTNDTYVNESDFNLYGGIMSKYRSWRYFSFNRLAMQMGNRIPPIMQFNSNQTLYGAFSGGRASNGGGVTANSTDPSMSGTSVTYHSFDCYAGPDFHDVLGSEDRLGSYGLNKWANNAANSTSASNHGSVAINNQHWDEVPVSSGAASGAPANNDFAMSTNHGLDYRSLKGFRFTMEDSCNLSGLDSNGYAGAWIGCPLDEGNSTQGSDSSNAGADSGFGIGGSAGNNARTWTSGYAEWGQGNYVVNCLPAYIWLSID